MNTQKTVQTGGELDSFSSSALTAQVHKPSGQMAGRRGECMPAADPLLAYRGSGRTHTTVITVLPWVGWKVEFSI